MANNKADLLQGTLDLLILKSLQNEPMHGFGIAVRIGQMSKDMLTVEQGSLYPALYRLEEQGWIKAEWGVSDNSWSPRSKAGRSFPPPSIWCWGTPENKGARTEHDSQVQVVFSTVSVRNGDGRGNAVASRIADGAEY